jgi:hypothetical protein
MTSAQMTTSVVLFFDAKQDQPIPITWYERALKMFDEYHFSPILFTAGGGDFELDDCHLLADGSDELYKWGEPEPIVPRRAELVRALHDGVIYSLCLDTPRADGEDREGWHATVSASSINNRLYMGIDAELASDPSALVAHAYKIAKGLYDIRYGFGYKMPLADLPDCFATGSRRFTFSDFKELMREKREGIRREPTRDDLWKKELMDGRRHLIGLFRDAYPVNILSESHLRAADLLAHRIGKLSKLDDSLWLWQLSEEEIPQAQAMLDDKKLLVSQAEHSM